jgi:peptide-methionine (S)-S-oxide reductase
MAQEQTMEKGLELAVFGGGCFWCTEAVFKMLRGVRSVYPGYAGGTVPNPTYEQVSTGTTGHAEVVAIEFDPAVIGYDKLLTVLFASHDPTTKDRQGNDVGPQYRSVIFYTTDAQRQTATAFIADLNASSAAGAPIVTALEPLSAFYRAEDYHLDYYARNKGASYCELVINPKLAKVSKQFAQLIKENK